MSCYRQHLKRQTLRIGALSFETLPGWKSKYCHKISKREENVIYKLHPIEEVWFLEIVL